MHCWWKLVTLLLTCDGVQYYVLSGVAWFVQQQSWQELAVSAGWGGGMQSRACVCHVTFSSSVNVVDYFLRDQNWLPRIRPPSIFSGTSRTQRRQRGAGAHGKESAAASWAGDGAVRQLVTQSPPRRWLCRYVAETFGRNKYMQSWNFISAVTLFFLVCAVSSLLQMADKMISQTLLDASTGRRIPSAPSSTWPSLPLLRYPHGPLSAYLCLCRTVSEFL